MCVCGGEVLFICSFFFVINFSQKLPVLHFSFPFVLSCFSVVVFIISIYLILLLLLLPLLPLSPFPLPSLLPLSPPPPPLPLLPPEDQRGARLLAGTRRSLVVRSKAFVFVYAFVVVLVGWILRLWMLAVLLLVVLIVVVVLLYLMLWLFSECLLCIF